MPASKYGKYFMDMPLEDCKFGPLPGGKTTRRIRFFCEEHFGKKDLSVQWNCVTAPAVMETNPHSHDFDQFLFFMGGDSTDISKFDAEVEICLGPECEKHVITKTTLLHIPKGMIHCPLEYKRIGHPIIFMNLALTPLYRKTEHPKS